MVVTREVCDKDLREIQHVIGKVSRLCITDKLQVECKQCPRGEKDKAEMRKVLYPLVVGSLMYAMVCTRSDIAFVVGAISQYMSN